MTVVREAQPSGPRSQTIDRATLILTCFSAEEPHLTLADLVAKLGLNQSTVYRYVATLQAAGLLERNGHRGGYRLGLRVVELACVALDQIEVRREAIPEMDRLRDEMQLLVNLAVLDPDQGDVIHIAHSAPQGWPPRATTPGRRAVAHCTALGKMLLAYRPWDEVRRAIERSGWRPYTPRSIQGFDRLEAELAEIRERGYSVDDEERSRGTICLGAPIRDRSDQVIAALSVTGTAQKLTPAYRAEILPHLIEAANRVSYRLGHPGTLAY
jgi:DNA-binding IclR family transcriptional regulator